VNGCVQGTAASKVTKDRVNEGEEEWRRKKKGYRGRIWVEGRKMLCEDWVSHPRRALLGDLRRSGLGKTCAGLSQWLRRGDPLRCH